MQPALAAVSEAGSERPTEPAACALRCQCVTLLPTYVPAPGLWECASGGVPVWNAAGPTCVVLSASSARNACTSGHPSTCAPRPLISEARAHSPGVA